LLAGGRAGPQQLMLRDLGTPATHAGSGAPMRLV
jgi:hypothetical protein